MKEENRSVTGTLDTAGSIYSYCMLCRTGGEKTAAQSIMQHFPDLTVFAPVKIHQEKRNGQWENHEQSLLPGYIFIYSTRELLPADLRSKVSHLYKALEYEKGMRILLGSDAEYAGWIYRHKGTIGTSRVMVEEGQSIKVIDGPLLDCQGTIIKLDKHKRRAMVAFTFDGQKRMVSISAQCVQPIESNTVE